MKTMITGADGQLGSELVKSLGDEVIGVTIKDFDLTDEGSVKNYIETTRPDAIIHCAAYTAVDKAEGEPDICRAVNALGARYVAEAAAQIGAKLLYVSTDYVFDGKLSRPYETTDEANPLNVYGKTKLEGENAVRSIVQKSFVVRTSWIFGQNGGNFVKTMLKLGRERDAVKVVGDQFGSPTYAPDLACLIAEIIKTDKYGIYHATNEGFCSWYEFACEIFKVADLPVETTPILTEQYPTAAARPKNSRLSKQGLINAGFSLLPPWRDSVKHFILGSIR